MTPGFTNPLWKIPPNSDKYNKVPSLNYLLYASFKKVLKWITSVRFCVVGNRKELCLGLVKKKELLSKKLVENSHKTEKSFRDHVWENKHGYLEA